MKSKVCIISSLFILLSLLLFYGISVALADGENKAVIIQIDEIDYEVPIHSELQKQYFNDSLESVLNYVSGDQENSRPESVAVSWETSIDEDFANAESIDASNLAYKLYVSKDKDIEVAHCYETSETSYSLTNLEVNTTYYYKVSSTIGDNTFESDISSFTTEAAGIVSAGYHDFGTDGKLVQ